MSEPEPLTRVMALHALVYCEPLFYLEEVEELRVADEAVYAGRALHERVQPSEGDEHQTFELASERLGIRGKIDAVRRTGGSWVPYEHKRGRARKSGTDPPVWESDRIQLGAYALLLEEHLGEPVVEGRVRYHADDATERVPIDDALRSKVAATVARPGELRKATERPPVTEDERLCRRCSLAPVCLPEEERLAKNPRHVPLRLFPADRDGQVLHVTNHAARIARAANAVHVQLPGENDHRFPINKLEAIVIHGHAQITTQAIHLCASHDVPLHWLSAGGRYIGGLAIGTGQVQRRIRQYRALSDPAVQLELSRRLAIARVEGQRRYLLRATWQFRERRCASMRAALDELRSALRRLPRALSLEELRGHEGTAGRLLRRAPVAPLDQRRRARLFCSHSTTAQRPLQRTPLLRLCPALPDGAAVDPRGWARASLRLLPHAALGGAPARPRPHGSVSRASWDIPLAARRTGATGTQRPTSRPHPGKCGYRQQAGGRRSNSSSAALTRPGSTPSSTTPSPTPG